MERDIIQLSGTARSPDDVERLHQLGLSFAEIPIPNPAEFAKNIKDYQKLKESLDMTFLCHGPKEGDPNDADSLEQVYLPKVMAIFPIMDQLDMRLLTIHLWLDARYVKEEILLYKSTFLRRTLEEADKWNITLCVENLSESADHLGHLFIEHPRLKMTLDLGHGELLTTRNRSYDFIEQWPDRIQHVHLHDNRGGDSQHSDLHLPPGDGMINLTHIITKLMETGYDRTVTLELTPGEIEGCLDRVKNLFSLSRQDSE